MSRSSIRFGERKLANGLTLLAVHNPGVGVFAANVALDVDLRDEQPGQAGLANMVGECLDEGAKGRTAEQLAIEVDKIGGRLSGTAAGGWLQCPVDTSRRGVQLLADVVCNPAFPVREVRRVQQEVLQEIRAEQDEPRSVAAERFRKEIYGRHPYGRPVRGRESAVAEFKPADLRRFHRQVFRPAGGYVAAAGPAPIEATLDLLEKSFSGMSGARPTRPPMPELRWPATVRDIHLPMKREQVHVYLGHPGIRRTDPDFYLLSVMDHILGTGPGFTSRITKRLRDQDGLCYAVDASIASSAGEEPGAFTAYIGTSAAHRARAIAGFREEIERIRRSPPTEQELHDVQEYLTGSFVWQLERNSNLARYAIRLKRFDLGFEFAEHYPELIRKITRKDVRAAAQKHLDPERVVIVSAGAGSRRDYQDQG